MASASASNIPWTWFESLKGSEVEFINKHNEKSIGMLVRFKMKYREQHAVIKKPGFVFDIIQEIPLSNICLSNFERLGYNTNHPIQQTKHPRHPAPTKTETESGSTRRTSFQDSPYTFRYEEVEYQKVDRVKNFRINDQVVWKVSQEKRDPTKPLIGRIQEIGFAMHSPSTYVAVVLFDENTTYYPKHVNLPPRHRNVVNIHELERLTSYMEFWSPFSGKEDNALIKKEDTSSGFETVMENKIVELVNQVHAHSSKKQSPILPPDAPKLFTVQQEDCYPTPDTPKLYTVQREDCNPTSFNITDESIEEEENLLVSFSPELKPKQHHKVIGIPKQDHLIPDGLETLMENKTVELVNQILTQKGSKKQSQILRFISEIPERKKHTIVSNPISGEVSQAMNKLSLPLKLRTLDGKTYSIEARADWNVKMLKDELQRITGNDSDLCILQFKAKRLADGESLSAYKIEPDSIIHASYKSSRSSTSKKETTKSTSKKENSKVDRALQLKEYCLLPNKEFPIPIYILSDYSVTSAKDEVMSSGPFVVIELANESDFKSLNSWISTKVTGYTNKENCFIVPIDWIVNCLLTDRGNSIFAESLCIGDFVIWTERNNILARIQSTIRTDSVIRKEIKSPNSTVNVSFTKDSDGGDTQSFEASLNELIPLENLLKLQKKLKQAEIRITMEWFLSAKVPLLYPSIQRLQSDAINHSRPMDVPKLYGVKDSLLPMSFNIVQDENINDEENLLVSFSTEIKPKKYHNVIGIPKEAPISNPISNNLSFCKGNDASANVLVNSKIQTYCESLEMNLEDFHYRIVNGNKDKIMGVQGHNSSCHLDASLFALFGFSHALDKCILPGDKTKGPEHELKARSIIMIDIVQEWRKKYFVGRKNVTKLRNILEEKFGFCRDAEETILALFQLIKVPSLFRYDHGEGDHIHQILMPETWDPSQHQPNLTVQTLLENSFKASDVMLNRKPKSAFILKLPVSDGVLIPCDGVISNLTLRLSSLIKSKIGNEREVHVLELSAIIFLRCSHFVTIARMKPDLKSNWIFMDSKPTTSVPEADVIEGLSEVIVNAEKEYLEGKSVSDFELPNGYMLFRDAYICVYTPASQFII